MLWQWAANRHDVAAFVPEWAEIHDATVQGCVRFERRLASLAVLQTIVSSANP